MSEKIKTLVTYEESGKNLSDFLKPFDQIDERLWQYIACEYVPSHSRIGKYTQAGEANNEIGGVLHYDTVKCEKVYDSEGKHVSNNFFYIGNMPCINGCCHGSR